MKERKKKIKPTTRKTAYQFEKLTVDNAPRTDPTHDDRQRFLTNLTKTPNERRRRFQTILNKLKQQKV